MYQKSPLKLKPWSGFPPLVLSICNYYASLALQKKIFSVDMLPSTVNDMYVKHRRRRGAAYDLHPDIKMFRDLTKAALGYRWQEWIPTGVSAAVIVYESPIWLEKSNKAARKDADNRVKVTLDAIEKASGVPDEMVWQFHVFKVASKRTRTVVYLFDLGPEIETV